ncbi:MAG: DNA polymerase III subunit epsilon, partial [Actinobacteria bacterium]|nr:DNA polymerase III subunit epsilon [Actinomycetota bacterium]
MPTNELEELLLAGTDDEVVAHYASLSTRAQDACFGLDEDEIVILDTETSGLNSARDEIIEIAAAIMKGPLVVSRFSTFVNPQKTISKETTKLTGITNDMLAGAPTIDIALREFASFVGSRDMVAHNAPFDRAFIMKHARPAEFRGDWMDSVELARIALPRLKAHSLPLLAGAFGTATPRHRAIDDVEALCGIWRILLVALSDFPEGLLSFIASLRPATRWSLRKVITHIAAANPDARFSLRVCRDANTKAGKLPVKNDASGSGLLFPTKREIRACFAKESILGAMYPGYEPREEQVLMAEEIAEAFETSTFRAIEAGTGVGKSIAYLLPAALSAKRNNIGIGVATKTNALMDQLVYYELPRLAKTLPDGLNYVALKGYEHYPCLRKLERFAKEETDYVGEKGAEREHAVLSMLATLYAFIGQSSWGDLDSINLYWKDLPKNQISALPGDCTHTHCSFFPTRCFLHGLRQRAKSADIVVTNHALLFRD